MVAAGTGLVLLQNIGWWHDIRHELGKLLLILKSWLLQAHHARLILLAQLSEHLLILLAPGLQGGESTDWTKHTSIKGGKLRHHGRVV